MKNIFKYSVLPIILGLFLTVGCEFVQLDEKVTPNSLSFTINGREFLINQGLAGTAKDLDGKVLGDLTGQPFMTMAKDENGDFESAIIASAEQVIWPADNDLEKLFKTNDQLLYFYFNKENDKISFKPVFLLGKDYSKNVFEDQSEFLATFEEKENYYQGTFSAKVVYNDTVEGKKTLEITDGKFNVQKVSAEIAPYFN